MTTPPVTRCPTRSRRRPGDGPWSASLPPSPARVLDAGTGTGSLAFVAADLGYEVTGVDLSEGMLERARVKAEERGVDVALVHGPAEAPPPGPFEAVIERHVLWTMPDPVAALVAWRSVTVPGGRLVLLEGSWGGEGPFVAATDALARVVERVYRHRRPSPRDVSRRSAVAAAGLARPGAVPGGRPGRGMGAHPDRPFARRRVGDRARDSPGRSAR